MRIGNDNNFILNRWLIRSLETNRLGDYLFGINSLFLKEDPRDVNSDHDFINTMLVYNQYNLENPDLNLAQRYVAEIIQQLEKDNFFNVYNVFESLRAQIFIEKNEWASFNLDKQQLVNILQKIKIILEQQQRYLKLYDYKKGSNNKDGVYGYIYENISDMVEYSGKKTL